MMAIFLSVVIYPGSAVGSQCYMAALQFVIQGGTPEEQASDKRLAGSSMPSCSHALIPIAVVSASSSQRNSDSTGLAQAMATYSASILPSDNTSTMEPQAGLGLRDP
jgi:hypothetical protein